jgi:hypothetical protein
MLMIEIALVIVFLVFLLAILEASLPLVAVAFAAP